MKKKKMVNNTCKMYSVIFVNDCLNQGSVYSAQLVREWAYTMYWMNFNCNSDNIIKAIMVLNSKCFTEEQGC